MANKKKKTATTNTGAKSKEQLVIHQIVVKAPQRKVYDVGNWRTALSSADNGRTKQLYDLLDDIMIDGVFERCRSKAYRCGHELGAYFPKCGWGGSGGDRRPDGHHRMGGSAD